VSSFSMLDLMREPTTVFMITPSGEMKTQGRWLRLVLAAAMRTFKKRYTDDMVRTLFLIDEFPALGRIEEFPEEALPMGRGHGMDFALAMQGLDQLKDTYPVG